MKTLRLMLLPGAWLGLLALVVFDAAFPALALRFRFFPLLASLVFLGLPHGALDHRVIPWLTARPLTPHFLVVFTLIYAALAALYGLFWHAFPVAAFVAFLILAWLHWGQGDDWAMQNMAGRPPIFSPARRLLVWLTRGALPIVLPIFAFPAVFREAVQSLTGKTIVLGQSAQIAGISGVGILTLAYLVAAKRKDGESFRVDIWEIGLLWLAFTRVEPYLAIGVYFGIWHGARHLGRLTLAAKKPQETFGATAAKVARQSLPLTFAALIFLFRLWTATGARTTPERVSAYLAFIAALTFPHFLLVMWMDGKQGMRPVK